MTEHFIIHDDDTGFSSVCFCVCLCVSDFDSSRRLAGQCNSPVIVIESSWVVVDSTIKSAGHLPAQQHTISELILIIMDFRACNCHSMIKGHQSIEGDLLGSMNYCI